MNEEIHNRSESGGKVRLMFQDEAGFGRINKPKYCWCQKGVRPSVPCHHIRGDRRKFCVNDKKGQYEKQRLSQEWK